LGKALDAFLAGRYAHALVLFEKEILENPEDPYLYFHFALSCFHTKNYKKTIEVCNSILSRFRGFVESDRIYKIMIFSLIQMRQWAEAEKILKQRLSISPKDAILLNFLAHVREKQGDLDSAIAIYREVLQFHLDHKTSLNNLGYLLLIRKDPPDPEDLKEAAKCLKKALQIDPNNPAYLDSLGTLLEKTGNQKKALEALEKAVRFAPEHTELLEHLAKLRKE